MAKTKKPKPKPTPSFVLTLPLVVAKQQEGVLYKEFHKCWTVYNELVRFSKKKYKQMVKTKRYKYLLCGYRNSTKKSVKKAFGRKLNKLRAEYGFSNFQLQADVKKFCKHYGVHSQVGQKIATAIWNKWDDFYFGNGRTVHFKKLDDFHTFEGKSNVTGIVCQQEKDSVIICLNGLRLQATVRKGNNTTAQYQRDALQSRVKYCRIKRMWVNDGWKYYVQLVLQGHPPIKVHKETGEMYHPVKDGRIGIDIGTQTVAIVGDDYCDLKVLASGTRGKVYALAAEIRRIQRAMDRSRKATNKKYYNPNGTIKRLKRKNGHRQIRIWQYSNRYWKLLARYRDLNRILAATRKMEHCILANEVLAAGNNIFVEDMNYKALQKRSKETKVNKKTGRACSKKRFGASLNRCAPAEFVTILSTKAANLGGSVSKVDTFKTKASQFDHTDKSYTKKKLSQRVAKLSNGDKIQRDVYSAFLLQHVNEELNGYNMDAIKSDYEKFKPLYHPLKARLKDAKWLPSSARI